MSVDPFNKRLLLYWVNSLDIPSCLLASSLEDFCDGSIFLDMKYKIEKQIRFQNNANDPLEETVNRLQETIEFLQEKLKDLPLSLYDDEAVFHIIEGDEQAITSILASFRFIYGDGPDPIQFEQRQILTQDETPSQEPEHIPIKKTDKENYNSIVKSQLAWETELDKKLSKIAPPKKVAVTPQKMTPQKVAVTPQKTTPQKMSKETTMKLQQIMQEYSHLFKETPKAEHPRKPPVKPPTTTLHKKTPSIDSTPIKSRSANSPARTRVVSPRISDTLPSPAKRIEIPETVMDLVKRANIRVGDAFKASTSSNFLPTAHDFLTSFKNGVLLCRVVEFVEHMIFKGLHENPKSVAAMMHNVNKALEILRNKKGINERFLWSAEEVIQGNAEVIIGLLEDISKAYKVQKRAKTSQPSTPTKTPIKAASPRVSFSPIITKKSPKKEFDPLEAEARDWLLRLNFTFDDLNRNALLDPLRNGCLLCELVSLLENMKLHRVHLVPENEKQAIENIQKAFIVLRKRTKIPQEFFEDPLEFYNGNPQIMWPLLVHIKREYPYAVPNNKASSVVSSQNALLQWIESLNLLSNFPKKEVSFDDILPFLQQGTLLCDIVSTLENNEILGVFRPPRTKSTALSNISKALQILKVKPGMNQKWTSSPNEIYDGNMEAIIELLKSMQVYYSNPNSSLIGYKTKTSRDVLDKYILTSSQRPQKTNQSFLQEEEMPRAPLPKPEPYPSKAAEQPAFEPPALSLVIELSDWLRQIGFSITPQSLQKPALEEFRDGLLFCKIVENLEHKIIDGLTKNPKSPAQFLRNLEKVFEVLRQRKSMPVDLLGNTREIIKGDSKIIISILEQMKKAYKDHYHTR